MTLDEIWHRSFRTFMVVMLVGYFLCSCDHVLFGRDVGFEWDASPDHDRVSTYTVYVGTNVIPSTNWQFRAIAGTNLTVVVTGIWPGNWYAWATATATGTNGLESDPSNVVPFVVLRPPTLRVRPMIQTASTPTGPWNNFLPYPEGEILMTNSEQFVRVRLDYSQ